MVENLSDINCSINWFNLLLLILIKVSVAVTILLSYIAYI